MRAERDQDPDREDDADGHDDGDQHSGNAAALGQLVDDGCENSGEDQGHDPGGDDRRGVRIQRGLHIVVP